MKKELELSIIIPTLNEEKYLPKLLRSLKTNLKNINVEIIIVDAHSKDKTLALAKKSGIKNLRIFITKKGAAYQRNYGAKKAKAPLLLFLDADVVLPKDFLKKTLEEIKKRKLDVAACYCKPDKKKFFEICAFGLANIWMRIFEKIKPFGQSCYFVEKKLFEKLKGFDTSLSFGEDSELLERAKKSGAKFRVLNEKFILSTRDFEKYGRFSQSLAYIFLNFYRLLGKERRKEKHFYELYHKFHRVSPSRLEAEFKEGVKKNVYKRSFIIMQEPHMVK
ncbi:MAG: glycosyltransferase [Candidatus Pacearchaeota archaeon]|nr:glycosyltransferase [Candidatus Pacearchaeota archaeon]